jgi:hypothetical protein
MAPAEQLLETRIARHLAPAAMPLGLTACRRSPAPAIQRWLLAFHPAVIHK